MGSLIKLVSVTPDFQSQPFSSIIITADGWLCDGEQLIPFSLCPPEANIVPADPLPPPIPTGTEYMTALELLYDQTAQARKYDNRFTCALRAGYPSVFQQEGIAFGTWMDHCNAVALQYLAEVLEGKHPVPTTTELIAMMPTMDWPQSPVNDIFTN